MLDWTKLDEHIRALYTYIIYIPHPTTLPPTHQPTASDLSPSRLHRNITSRYPALAASIGTHPAPQIGTSNPPNIKPQPLIGRRKWFVSMTATAAVSRSLLFAAWPDEVNLAETLHASTG